MGQWSKIVLSGSTNGSAITVATTNTTVHTAVTGAADSVDEIWLYGHRAGADGAVLTINLGTGSFIFTASGLINPRGLHTILSGAPAVRNGVVITARATSPGAYVLWGYVNRYAT